MTVKSVTSSPIETTIPEGVAASSSVRTSTENDKRGSENTRENNADVGNDSRTVQGNGGVAMLTGLAADNSTETILERKAGEESLPTPSQEGLRSVPARESTQGVQEKPEGAPTRKSTEETNQHDSQANGVAESPGNPSLVEKDGKTVENPGKDEIVRLVFERKGELEISGRKTISRSTFQLIWGRNNGWYYL